MFYNYSTITLVSCINVYLQFFLINFYQEILLLLLLPLHRSFHIYFSNRVETRQWHVSFLRQSPIHTYIYIYINIARKLDNLIGSKQARKTWSLCSTQRGTSYTIDLPVVSSHTRRSKSGKSDVKSRDRSNRPLAPVNRENPREKIFKNSLPPLYCIIAARLGHKDLFIVFSK